MMSRQRALIIRLDGLGDTLLTLPLVAALKATWPECELTYLASPRGAPVFAADERVDQLWVRELAEMSRANKLELGRQIGETGFSVVFCLNEKFWPSVWTRMSGAAVRLGFDPGWRQLPKTVLRRLTLTHRLPAANDPGQPSIHEVERYAALASLADPALAALSPLDLRLPATAKAEALTALTQALPLSEAGLIPVAMHLSAKWTSEGWPPDSCLAVAAAVLEKFPSLFLLVTAGPSEQRFFAGATQRLPQGRFLLQTDLTFERWAALLANCRALLTMDTGAVHLAAAVGTPVVDVFPQLNFAHASSRWAPWQIPHRIVQRPVPGQANQFFAAIHAALEDLI